MQEGEKLCVAEFIIDVGTLQNSYELPRYVGSFQYTCRRRVEYRKSTADGKFLAPDLIYLFRSNDRRHSLRLIPSRSDL